MTLSAGTRLGAYEILSPLGAGGMGEVYRARDSKLDRDVAVKVLPRAVAADPEAMARFEREAKAVAALSHPNILAIFDFGTHEGIAYAVTELLEGETLGAKLATGPIPQKQAVDYALQVARGLSAAHEKGIVHRDLKPENLFVVKGGHLKILDFGLAKKIQAVAAGDETSAPTVTDHTTPGTVMGTVGYMSPEQVRGLSVDHRSDLFSFGTILYEMLTGTRAFKRNTVADTMSAILNEDPPDLSEAGHGVPVALDRVVRHCLEKDRDDRFQSARDFAFALSEAWTPAGRSGERPSPRTMATRGALVAAIAIALGFAGLLLSRRSPRVGSGAAVVKRVAVLPFENLGAPGDDYFADGIADAVRGKLTSLAGVEVVARASSTPYKKTKKNLKRIAEELDASYLLTATVRWQKKEDQSRVQVSPELVEVKAAGAPASKWQQPFDAPLTDVFQMQSDIATRVAEALGVALAVGEQRRLFEKPTQNLTAYEAFLKGEEASKSMGVIDPPSLQRALDFYDEAVALDPGFAQAWAQVSRANTNLYFFNVPTPQLAERARQAADKAIALAPDALETCLALADYQRWVVKDYRRALSQCSRNLESGSADVLSAIALAEEYLGQWDAALGHLKRAKRLDPRSVLTQRRLAEALLLLRKYSEAREACDQGLGLAPADLWLLHQKARTFLGQGDLARARAVLRGAPKEIEPTALVAFVANIYDLAWVLDRAQREILVRLTPRSFDDDRGAWGLCLLQADALAGDTASLRSHAEEARKAFEEQVRTAPQDAQRHALLGLTLAYLGRKEEAIREGEHGVALLPVTKDAYDGPYYQHQLVRIYILVNEHEKALDQLEPLLKTPYFLSPAWLKIDPNFDPLRKSPRFQKLVAGTK